MLQIQHLELVPLRWLNLHVFKATVFTLSSLFVWASDWSNPPMGVRFRLYPHVQHFPMIVPTFSNTEKPYAETQTKTLPECQVQPSTPPLVGA